MDGNRTDPPWIWDDGPKLGHHGDDNNVHAPWFRGTGQVITFRIQAIGPDIAAAGVGFVFFE